MSAKADILWRVNLLFYIICFIAAMIMCRVGHIQMFEGEKWMAEGSKTTMTDTIEGLRGNIYDDRGMLLATSLTYYKVSIDPTIPSDEDLRENLGELSRLLSKKFGNCTAATYRSKIEKARKKNRRYLTLQDNVNYNELQEMLEWPLFNKGRYAGGLITEPFNKRVRPFGRPAWRTIGVDRINSQSIGLEATYSRDLKGPDISRVLERMPGGDWVRRFDIKNDDKKGHDLELTLDIQLQDIADKALEKALRANKAEHGCAIVMEVETGAVKAISNLGKNKKGEYWEDYNYAMGKSTEPGSTFKLVTTLALLEDGRAKLDENIDIHLGYAKFYDKKIIDSHPIYLDSLSLRNAFVKSSNVAISKFTDKYFGDREKLFYDYVEQFGLTTPTGIEINGEPDPKIKRPESAGWTGVTLPYMSMGYETLLTPLQILRFYNAVANDGEMMKPYLVKSIKDGQQTIENYEPVSLGRICRAENAELVRELCTEVVETGTAKSIRSPRFSMAGKTGTAKFMDYDLDKKDKVYQASFAGFFPAENPKYSCIVTVHAPQAGKIYGGAVAAPVFKEIVEKYFSLKYDFDPIDEESPRIFFTELPEVKTGHRDDWATIYQGINVPCMPYANSEFVTSVLENDTVYFEDRVLKKEGVPDVTGMGIRDALFVLEQKGLRVRYSGSGKVAKQTPPAEASLDNYKTVYLELI